MPDIQLVFLALAMGVIWGMKGLSLAGGARPAGLWLFLLAPLPAPQTWARRAPAEAGQVGSVIMEALRYALPTAAAYGFYWALAPALSPPPLALAYLAALPAFISGLAVMPLTRLALLPLGIVLPPFHRRPEAARSLSAFWGNGWNLWIAEWYKHALFRPLRRSPRRAAFLTFLFSGIVHEFVINTPAALLHGWNSWGLILLYFLAQWAGIVVDRRLIRSFPALRRAWCWLVLAGPAPLLINEPILRILFLWPY